MQDGHPLLQEVRVNGNGNGNGKKKRRKRIIITSVVVLGVLVLVGGLVAATSGGTKIDPSKLAKVEKGDLAKSVVATGKVTPITKVEVKSKASGIVKKLYVEAGDKVKKGQLLAQLDKEEIQAQVAQSTDPRPAGRFRPAFQFFLGDTRSPGTGSDPR